MALSQGGLILGDPVFRAMSGKRGGSDSRDELVELELGAASEDSRAPGANSDRFRSASGVADFRRSRASKLAPAVVRPSARRRPSGEAEAARAAPRSARREEWSADAYRSASSDTAPNPDARSKSAVGGILPPVPCPAVLEEGPSWGPPPPPPPTKLREAKLEEKLESPPGTLPLSSSNSRRSASGRGGPCAARAAASTSAPVSASATTPAAAPKSALVSVPAAAPASAGAAGCSPSSGEPSGKQGDVGALPGEGEADLCRASGVGAASPATRTAAPPGDASAPPRPRAPASLAATATSSVARPATWVPWCPWWLLFFFSCALLWASASATSWAAMAARAEACWASARAVSRSSRSFAAAAASPLSSSSLARASRLAASSSRASASASA
mmetsp:Transcript_50922/g.115693  ORF Transcript_50922/g.115693 Transcript_50922/m.115693 type:complete len:389 (+) Transcript_50922:242-1408(+)